MAETVGCRSSCHTDSDSHSKTMDSKLNTNHSNQNKSRPFSFKLKSRQFSTNTNHKYSSLIAMRLIKYARIRALQTCYILSVVVILAITLGDFADATPVRRQYRQETVFQGFTRKLDIQRRDCYGGTSDSAKGTCMFNFECIQKKGNIIGTCVDGFLFGVCCELESQNIGNEDLADETEQRNEVPAESSERATIIPHISSIERDQLLVTKTKPDTSVLLYNLDVLDKPTLQVNDHKNDIYSLDDTHTNMLQFHESLYQDTDIGKLPAILLNSNKPTTSPAPPSISTYQTVQDVNGNYLVTDKIPSVFEEENYQVTTEKIASEEIETTEEPLLIWTLKPRPFIFYTRTTTESSTTPKISGSGDVSSAFMTVPVKERTTLSEEEESTTATSYLMEDEESEEVEMTTQYPMVPTEMRVTLNVTDETTEPFLMTKETMVDVFPLWDTVKDKPKRPSLVPLSTTSAKTQSTTPQLFFWTTPRPQLRPRPTTKPITTQATTVEIATTKKETEFLIPNISEEKEPLNTNELIDNLIISMSDVLNKDEENVSLRPTTYSSPSTTTPWATSTYAILPMEFDISENIIEVDTSSRNPTSTKISVSDIPKHPTTTESPMSSFLDFDLFDITSPSPINVDYEHLQETTVSSIDENSVETTPIDEFIENLLNSLIRSNTTRAPPIDLDLIQQMLSGEGNIGIDSIKLPDISSFADLSNNTIDTDSFVSMSSILTTESTSTTMLSSSTSLSTTEKIPDTTVTKKSTIPTTTTTTERPLPSTTTTTKRTTTPFTLPPFKQDTTTTTTSTTTTTTTTTTMPSTTTPNWDWRTTCGVRPLARTGRIVNGKVSNFGDWPWQVLVKESTWLGLFTKNKCGGVLLNERYVLTAAHCKPGFLASLIVVLGDVDLSGGYEPSAPIERNVKRVIIHKGYIARTFDNDLALLELATPVQYDQHILPICLPETEDDYIGDMATVTGWGRTSYGGPVPDRLQVVELPVITNTECQDWFHEAGHRKVIKPEFMCAGYKSGVKDSCEGDSGGPLAIQGHDGRWILAGTVSHGIKCAKPNLPGVYMRMSFYKPWITNIIYG